MFKSLLAFLLFTTLSFSLLAQYDEQIEPEYIKTIQFVGNTNQSQLPILRLGEPLYLTFDALNGEEADFYYRITHHNFDWTKSDLSQGEFMTGFNDVRIFNYKNKPVYKG